MNKFDYLEIITVVLKNIIQMMTMSNNLTQGILCGSECVYVVSGGLLCSIDGLLHPITRLAGRPF